MGKVVIRIKISTFQAATREIGGHSNRRTATRVTRTIRKPITLFSFIARDLHTESFGIRSVLRGSCTADHFEAGGERFNLVSLREVIDTSTAKDG